MEPILEEDEQLSSLDLGISSVGSGPVGESVFHRGNGLINMFQNNNNSTPLSSTKGHGKSYKWINNCDSYRSVMWAKDKWKSHHGIGYNDTNDLFPEEKNCFCPSVTSKSALSEVLSMVKVISPYALIFLLSVNVFWNSLSGQFVHDDIVAIIRNPDVNLALIHPHSRDSSLFSLLKNDYWGTPMSSLFSHKSYRPLTVLSFRLNYWMCGESLCPEYFHGTNVLIHGLVSALTFHLCWSVLRLSLTTCLFASSLFAVHPIHTEAVAGITGRADALACLMMLTSFLFYDSAIKSSRKIKSEDDTKSASCTNGSESCGSSNSWEKSDCKSTYYSSSCTLLIPSALATSANGLLLASGLVGCGAMLAKETGITVLAINLLYDLYSHRVNKGSNRSRSGNSSAAGISSTRRNDHASVGIKTRTTFLLILMVCSLSVRLVLMNGSFPRFSRSDNPTAHSPSKLTRLLTFAYLPVFNMNLILYPKTLSYDWQMGSIPLVESPWDLRNLYSCLFYISLLLLFWKLQKTSKLTSHVLVVGLLFIILPFLPASNVFFPVGFVVAERILYTTSFGVCIIVAFGLSCVLSMTGQMAKKMPSDSSKLGSFFNIFIASVSVLVLLSFGIRTWQRNSAWQSRSSLFSSGIRDVPTNAKMHYNYANLEKDRGNIVKAIEHYSIAISLWPEYPSAHNNLGTLLMANPAAAEHHFLKAIAVAGQAHGGAHFNLGVLYMNNEKFAEAAMHFKKSLSIDPSHYEAVHYLTICLGRVNNQTDQRSSLESNQGLLSSSQLSNETMMPALLKDTIPDPQSSLITLQENALTGSHYIKTFYNSSSMEGTSEFGKNSPLQYSLIKG